VASELPQRATVIVYAGTAGRAHGTGTVRPGAYLKSCDLEYADGAGLVTWTNSAAEAMVFGSFREAFEAWRAVPKSRPLRPDGEPNRPLTAFTVALEDAPAVPGGQ
jgi:hypothetical protein